MSKEEPLGMPQDWQGMSKELRLRDKLVAEIETIAKEQDVSLHKGASHAFANAFYSHIDDSVIEQLWQDDKKDTDMYNRLLMLVLMMKVTDSKTEV